MKTNDHRIDSELIKAVSESTHMIARLLNVDLRSFEHRSDNGDLTIAITFSQPKQTAASTPASTVQAVAQPESVATPVAPAHASAIAGLMSDVLDTPIAMVADNVQKGDLLICGLNWDLFKPTAVDTDNVGKNWENSLIGQRLIHDRHYSVTDPSPVARQVTSDDQIYLRSTYRGQKAVPGDEVFVYGEHLGSHAPFFMTQARVTEVAPGKVMVQVISGGTPVEVKAEHVWTKWVSKVPTAKEPTAKKPTKRETRRAMKPGGK